MQLNETPTGMGVLLPLVFQINEPFLWAPVAEIMLPETHSTDAGHGAYWSDLWLSANKRKDSHYPKLLADIRMNGYRSPVFWSPSRRVFNNGHHRLAAALDLGFTHIPTTEVSERTGWDDHDWIRGHVRLGAI